jgi:hypothetical protein
MLLKIYQTNTDELKSTINITFLKSYIKQERIEDLLEFTESLDPIIQDLIYENEPKDLRNDIIRDLLNLPIKHSVKDICEILETYQKLYEDKEEEYMNDNLIEQIRHLQKRLVEYTWGYYGVIDDNSYYLFAYQDNKFPFKAVLIPTKYIPQEVKEKFERLRKYGEYFSPSKVEKEDQESLSYFMMLVDNSPSNEQQIENSEWISRCKFTYKPLYSTIQSINEYIKLKDNNDVNKSIFLS